MRIIQYIGVILFFFLVSCEKDNVEPQKTRTLMVYLAGDNNLSGHMQKNISSMMSAWKKSYNANIVIYFDAPNAAPELYTFRFKGKEVEKQVLKTYEEMDSADPEVLKKTIAQYNDDLAKQSDPKFSRRFDRSAKPIGSGPYFVSEMSPKVHHCMGGVATAVDTAVLDVMTDKPIPGLFAAGEFVGGIHGAVRIGACAVMDCLVNGREAGRMAAESKAWF